MASDEQRVRTMCGWIGVELSRSRVRTPGRAGYGLYRVRGVEPVARPNLRGGPDVPGWRATEWTAYAFTLEQIQRNAADAISRGTPQGPGELDLMGAQAERGKFPRYRVPTRWTSSYRGRRDLGMRQDASGQTRPGRVLVGDEGSGVSIPPAGGGAREGKRETVRSRQRAANVAFQREHGQRRAVGLQRRHDRKLSLPKRDGQGGAAPI